MLLLLLFSKNSHSDLDLEPGTLKVELARDIIRSNYLCEVTLKSINKCRHKRDDSFCLFVFF